MKGSSGRSITTKYDGSLFGDLSFVITAAHELKAPLSLIRQLSLSLETGDLSSIEKERLVEQITLTSERALRLTTDLSRSSRLEDSLFECEPLNPVQLCEEVAHELSPLFAAKNRQIHVSSHKRSLLVIANRDLLRRIMLNFADNALHYSDPSLPVELRTMTTNHGQAVRMGVRDYGPAVANDVWQRLYQHLGKGTQAMHNRPQSSGLGLYVSGQFAKAMHGEIGAIRHRDGATFYVELGASTQMRLL